MSTAIYKTVKAMLQIIGIAAIFTMLIIIVCIENENQVLVKLNKAKDTINKQNQGEIVKIKGSWQYQWITKYNNDTIP